MKKQNNELKLLKFRVKRQKQVMMMYARTFDKIENAFRVLHSNIDIFNQKTLIYRKRHKI